MEAELRELVAKWREQSDLLCADDGSFAYETCANELEGIIGTDEKFPKICQRCKERSVLAQGTKLCLPCWGESMSQKSFTLIEMLVVIGILCILAGLVFPIMKMVWRKNADAKTRATIGQVQGAIDAYHTKRGYYPQMRDTNGDGQPDMPATTNLNGHRLYLSQVRSWGMDTGKLKTDGTFVLDFYKRPLRYRCPGLVNTKTYDIWSTGADKKDGKDTGDLKTSLTRDETDDLNNWR